VLAQGHQVTRFVGPALHLQVLNPHVKDDEDHDCYRFPMEPTTHQGQEFPMWACVNGFGHGGTYASAVVRAELPDTTGEPVDQANDLRTVWALNQPDLKFALRLPCQEVQNTGELELVALKVSDRLHFWPAGGGELEPHAIPSDGYYITGSFNEFDRSQRMLEVEPDVWEAFIILGDNQFESFQILIDGDPDRVLHPGPEWDQLLSAVLGPDERCDCEDLMWKVGRPLSFRVRMTGLNDEGSAVEAETDNPGDPGDRYEVRLSIAGKFRKVAWRNLGPSEAEDGAVAVVPSSTYYVVANWNKWVFAPMTQDPSIKGLWFYTADLTEEMKVLHSGFVFYIVRSKDPFSAFYPSEDDADDPSVEMIGPSWNSNSHCWMLHGFDGNSVTIEFQRTLGLRDQRRVFWTFETKGSVAGDSAVDTLET